ncbi:sensor domain-containing protein [Nakamurella endophytica]|uniref:EAL domain-containing protein n=1 Tax=Nakamurella endophytica TaxID=1748367 RepID=A0A917T3S2_9ACTN|nr:EAL domain-containing protein [Nakamurella endophytica]GGM09211.1 hypothetical protein GCM10011594_31400 [Nakamurella endophytica]
MTTRDDPLAVLDDRDRRIAELELELAGALQWAKDNADSLRNAEDLAKVGSWRYDLRTREMSWSPMMYRIFGRSPELPPLHVDELRALLPAEDAQEMGLAFEIARETGRDTTQDFRLEMGGRTRQMLARFRVEERGGGALMIGCVQDVTELNATAREFRRALQLLTGVLGATPQAVLALDVEGRVIAWNSGAEELLGRPADEMVGRNAVELHDPAELVELFGGPDADAAFRTMLDRSADAHSGPGARSVECTYLAADGRRLRVLDSTGAVRSEAGTIEGYVKVGTDITALSETQAELQASERQFRDTFESAPNGMMLISLERSTVGKFLRVNPALSRLTGYSEDELLGMTLRDLVHPEHRKLYDQRIANVLRHRDVEMSPERRWVAKDGHDIWILLHLNETTDPVVGRSMVAQVEDITVRKDFEARLTHLALHDNLTQLPNRALLMDRIDHALSASGRTRSRVAVMYIDLDDFKAVNDTAGHAAGDHTLVEVADRLRGATRPGDTVSRLGGDEFVVVCPEIHDDAAAVRIAERILARLHEPHHIGEYTFAVGGSIGVALSVPDCTPQQMMAWADEAMYAGKRAGKGRIRLDAHHLPAGDERHNAAVRRIRIDGELRDALNAGGRGLQLWGQPIVDLATQHVVGVELLLRWRHPSGTLLGPGDFLDVAEDSDLVVGLGEWALDESCRMAADWLSRCGSSTPEVHVNVSGRQMQSGGLHRSVTEALERHGIPPGLMVLELTETQAPTLEGAVRADLDRLQQLGVRFAIDDVGTGYSSLARLTELPVDLLKVDVNFVAGIGNDPACEAVIRGILAIGAALDMAVVAEGVETPEQATWLLDKHCRLAQGFHLGRPLPEAELLAALTGAPARAAGTSAEASEEGAEALRRLVQRAGQDPITTSSWPA